MQVEFRVVRLQEPFFLLPGVFERLFGVPFAFEIVIDGNRFTELFDVAVGLGAEFVPQLPVHAGAGIHVFPAGIIIIPGEVFGGRLLFDPFEDVGLVFGSVGIDGLLVVRPEFGQGVAVVLGTGGEREVHQGQKS